MARCGRIKQGNHLDLCHGVSNLLHTHAISPFLSLPDFVQPRDPRPLDLVYTLHPISYNLL
jgi:coenzyme F420-reducing hydrogenase alpha subunit